MNLILQCKIMTVNQVYFTETSKNFFQSLMTHEINTHTLLVTILGIYRYDGIWLQF